MTDRKPKPPVRGKDAPADRPALDQAFDQAVRKAYENAMLAHGDLGLPETVFRDRILAIARKQLGDRVDSRRAADFASKLNTGDLYLAVACGVRDERAWARFSELYRRLLRDMHHYVARTQETPADLADQTLVDMFLPDRSGQSRIASYDGRSSLHTWLRVCIANRAINERQLACNRVKKAEPDADIPDAAPLSGLESRIREGRYRHVLIEALQSACVELSNQERLILLWRFDKGLQLGQIAKFNGVHQSTITRQMEKMLERLRGRVVQYLTGRHELSPEAVEECLGLVFDTSHSIPVIEYIRDATDVPLSAMATATPPSQAVPQGA